jgi:hypothetical protein
MTRKRQPKLAAEPMINWFGREAHPSDEFIHWSDQSNFLRGWGAPVTHSARTFNEYVDALRAAYDLIHSDKIPTEVKEAFELIQEAQAHKISCEEGERAAGEDL